jgi:glutaredoxin
VRNRRFRDIVLLAIYLISAMGLPAYADSPAVRYFYQKNCESCNPQTAFYDEFNRLTGKDLSRYSYEAWDVDRPQGMKELEAALNAFGTDLQNVKLPVLIFENRLYMGQDQIRKELPAYVVESGGDTDSFFYFVSVTGCESCEKVERMLKDLPQTIHISRGDYTFHSPVRYAYVNLLNESELAAALFDAYRVEEGKRTAPVIFAGDTYYQGEEMIRSFLKYSLPAGKAVGTPVVSLDGEPAGVLEQAWKEFVLIANRFLAYLAFLFLVMAAFVCTSKDQEGRAWLRNSRLSLLAPVTGQTLFIIPRFRI